MPASLQFNANSEDEHLIGCGGAGGKDDDGSSSNSERVNESSRNDGGDINDNSRGRDRRNHRSESGSGSGSSSSGSSSSSSSEETANPPANASINALDIGHKKDGKKSKHHHNGGHRGRKHKHGKNRERGVENVREEAKQIDAKWGAWGKKGAAVVVATVTLAT